MMTECPLIFLSTIGKSRAILTVCIKYSQGLFLTCYITVLHVEHRIVAEAYVI